MPEMNTTYVVLGIPRSGTSIVSRLLHLCGISMGQRFQTTNEEWNKDGFYECRDSIEIVTEIMERRPLVITNGKLIDVHDWSAVEKYKAYIRRRCGEGTWGLKQYKLPMFLSDFVGWCPNEVAAIVTRRPINESVVSLFQRGQKEGITLDGALKHLSWDALWLDDSLARFTGRVLEIDFLSLIENPEAAIRGLSHFIGRTFSPTLVNEVFPASKRLGVRKRLPNRYRIDTTPNPLDPSPTDIVFSLLAQQGNG